MATFFDPISGQIVSIPTGSVSVEEVAGIDTETNPPVDGQALVWNSATGSWEPGTVLDAEGDPVFAGSTASSISGSDVSNWNTAYSWGDHKIDGTAVPVDGQVLAWDAATDKWLPETISVSSSIQTASDFELNPGAYPSWPTKTSNFDVPNNGNWYSHNSYVIRVKAVDINGTDWTPQLTALGNTGTFWFSTDDGLTWTSKANTDANNMTYGYFQLNLSPFYAYGYTGSILISFTDPVANPIYAPLQNEQILRYDASESKFKPATLATVAETGSYNDLSSKPVLSAVATSGSYTDLTNKPTLSTVATTGSYNDLTAKPALATVATTGSYNDLTNKPSTIAQTVDTVSNAPVANKKLGYTSNNKWEPVDIKIQEAADFKLNAGAYPSWNTKTIDYNVPNNGNWYPNGSNVLRIKPIDSNGTNWTSSLTTLGTTGTFWYSTDGGVNWTSKVNTGGFNNLPSWFQLDLSPFNVNSYTGGFLIAFADPITNPIYAPLQDKQILQYNLSETKFKPATLATVATTGSYTDLTNKPTLATVAGTGSYNDLSGKPVLSAVATSGNYNDLTNTPSVINGRVTDSGTASGGVLTLTGSGKAGLLRKISSNLDAWIVIYGSAAARTADAARTYSTDPIAGDGVLAEVYVSAGSSVSISPATMWYNDDTSATSAMYLAVRSQAGAAVNATVTVDTYRIA